MRRGPTSRPNNSGWTSTGGNGWSGRATIRTGPENRLVARELEKRWEQSLATQRGAEEAYARFLHEQPPQLSQADQETVRTLSADIPALWHSPQTTAAERQQIVRHLIERVVLTAPPRQEIADVAVHWAERK